MLSASDLLHLPYTPDLTEGGIAYACRSLAHTYDRMGGSPVERLQRTASGVAVELAFRRHLSEQNVPFDVLGATPFTDPDRYDISLGGHRCELKSFLITRRRQITFIRHDPSLLLDAPALIPLDQFAAEGHTPQDIYIFAFCLALTASSQDEMRNALAAGQPVYLIHPMPEEWRRPPTWLSLERLALKSESGEALNIEISGMDAERNFITTALDLQPRRRTSVEQVFYSLLSIHAKQAPPSARIGLHSPVRGEAHIIQPHEWGNIYVYGMEIILTGYLNHEEFRRKASVLNAGMPTFQYDRTRTKNLLVPVRELEPLAPLFEKVMAWGMKE